MQVSIYPTPDSMRAKVNEYFCYLEEYNANHKGYKPPTMVGLARYLGFTTRAQFVNYKNDDQRDFEDVVNEAKMRIEEFYEEKLIMAKGPSTGIQFALKNNCGWEEKTKQQITGDGDKPLVFTWDDQAKDVIDVNPDVNRIEAPKPQLTGGVPVGEGAEISTLTVEVLP